MHFQTSHLFENCIVVYASWGQIQKLRSVSQRNFMFKTKKTNAKDVVLHFDLNLSSTCRNEEESGKKFVWYTKVGPWDAILNMKLDIFRYSMPTVFPIGIPIRILQPFTIPKKKKEPLSADKVTS